MALNKL